MKRIVLLLLTVSNFSFSQDLNDQISAIEKKLISWRHDIHKHPELSNREYRTSKVIAEHLKSLNIEVRENVAKIACRVSLYEATTIRTYFWILLKHNYQ